MAICRESNKSMTQITHIQINTQKINSLKKNTHKHNNPKKKKNPLIWVINLQINKPCKLEKATYQGTGCPKNQEDKDFSYQTIQNTLIQQQILKEKNKHTEEGRAEERDDGDPGGECGWYGDGDTKGSAAAAKRERAVEVSVAEGDGDKQTES
jgi:hypothetical protein